MPKCYHYECDVAKVMALPHHLLLFTNMLIFSFLFQNGSSRSLCAALDCFASLFPYIRPSRCNSYAQALLPVLVRVTGREEEALHESLQEAFGKILPTMTPFLSTANLQVRVGLQ